MMPGVTHMSRGQLEKGLADVLASPTDHGRLERIVIRPEEDHRRSLASCRLSPELGVTGDSWARNTRHTLPDGSPHPDSQVTIINSRLIHLVACELERWELAGDNLYLDMDLSAANLPPGARIEVGEAVLEVTAKPHLGCRKFAERYGMDAREFVNDEERRNLNLRGVHAKVVREGVVKVGDVARKL